MLEPSVFRVVFILKCFDVITPTFEQSTYTPVSCT